MHISIQNENSDRQTHTHLSIIISYSIQHDSACKWEEKQSHIIELHLMKSNKSHTNNVTIAKP